MRPAARLGQGLGGGQLYPKAAAAVVFGGPPVVGGEGEAFLEVPLLDPWSVGGWT